MASVTQSQDNTVLNIRRANVSASGTQGNADAGDPAYADPTGAGVNERGPDISNDGRYVTYTSAATNHGGGTPLVTNVFLKDLDTGALGIVSKAGKTLANDLSYNASLTPDGRYVVFTSLASNLVAKDTNKKTDIFRYDVTKGTVTRVSMNGSLQGDGRCDLGSISDDGQSVAFYSYWNTVVAGATTQYDVLLQSAAGKLMRASTNAAGTAANDHSKMPALSGDGRYLVFLSEADNLVSGNVGINNQVYRKDLKTGAVALVSQDAKGVVAGNWNYAPDVSSDGHVVAFSTLADFDPRDAAWSDIYVKNMDTGALQLASASTTGQGGNDSSYLPSLSGDGRFVVFYSRASNLVAGDTNGRYDVFVKDLQTGKIAAVSTAADGTFGNNHSYGASISANGRWIAFYSKASNLVAGDTNNAEDVFVADNPLDDYCPRIEGTSGDDTLNGSDGNETLVGGAGNDSLDGGAGNDWLYGDPGNDVLTGGKGQDSFVLGDPSQPGVDVFVDFQRGEDRIVVVGSQFNGLSALRAADLLVGAGKTAPSKGQHFIYNTSTGALYYDADGDAQTPAVLLTTVGKTTHPTLSLADFVCV